MFSLAGKTCVVTGAGRGIGRAIALDFARQGANVVGAARRQADLDSLTAEIEAAGGTVFTKITDVTSHADVDALAAAAVERFGKIDTWVNNAGGFIDGAMCDWIDVEDDGLQAMLQLNLVAQIWGAQAAARAMRETGGGCIIFTGSLDSYGPAPGGEGVYGACKIAINHITETMAVELGQYGIRVNTIAPAVIQTDLTAPFLGSEEIRENRAKMYPLGRLGKPSDVSSAAVYLASDEASWVSGAVLLVSGGVSFTSDPFRYLNA